jgi:hypothetical protein
MARKSKTGYRTCVAFCQGRVDVHRDGVCALRLGRDGR